MAFRNLSDIGKQWPRPRYTDDHAGSLNPVRGPRATNYGGRPTPVRYYATTTNVQLYDSDDSQYLLDYDLDHDFSHKGRQEGASAVNLKRTHLKYYPLHSPGININGRLPCEAPSHQDTMDDDPTQPLTQRFDDPRRQGSKSMLSEDDEADIIAILHPSSVSAHTCVSLTAAAAPQHILQNHNQSQIQESSISDDEDSSRSSKSAQTQDIALRFSSRVYNLCSGFYFGRTPMRSDILLCGRDNKSVSSRHFRIFINKNGILMLEDTSINGTVVDRMVIHGGKGHLQRGAQQPMITLHHGAIIEMPTITSGNGESVRFIVAIPSRDGARSRYRQNLFAYLACIAQEERRAAVAVQTGGKVLPTAPLAFGNALLPGIRQELNPHVDSNADEIVDPNDNPNASTLLAGTDGNQHGMAWNGGDKYNVVSYVDKGAFAMVYKLSGIHNGEVYAAKQLEKRRILKDGHLGRRGHNELEVMKTLRHPNIVQYIDSHETDDHMFIIMEFIHYGDLKPWTNPNGKPMPEYMVVYVARQMLDALGYLHERGITHRDIKPDNILMASNYPWVFKLSDFGLSKIVNNEETFLKTFCGTLLYLAPEVFPGYTRVKAGLSPIAKKGRNQPPNGTLPYQHSVDIWSLGAVLYQLLTGNPPHTGNADEQGANMLITVMNNPVDYSLLTCGGVSDEAIDFLQRMLIVEPSYRERETELLQHPWLAPKSNPVDLSNNAAISSQAELLDTSQLSLADDLEEQTDAVEYEDDSDEESDLDLNEQYDEHYDPETQDSRVSKRARDSNYVPENYWVPPGGGGGLFGAIEGSNDNTAEATSGAQEPQVPQLQQRLFGEIGSSALQSSGVLGENANAALEVPVERNSDEDYPGGSYIDQVDSMDFALSADFNHDRNTQHTQGEDVTAQNVQYPYVVPGPAYVSGASSLLGAEAQIGQLNMASPEPGATAPSVDDDDKQAEPDTPANQSFSPALTASKRPSQALESNEGASDIKRPKTDNPLSSPRKKQHVVDQSSQLTSARVTRSKTSTTGGGDVADDAQPRDNTAVDPAQANLDTQNPSQNSNLDDLQDGQQERDAAKSQNSSMPATASNSQDSIHNSQEASNDTNKTEEVTPTKPSPPKRDPSPPSVAPFLTVAPASTIPDGTFTKPPVRFGNLVPTFGSIKTVPKIKITQIGTTYGRASDCTFKHPNSLETRVPKYAFDIQMFYPNIYKDLYAGRKDWYLKPELTALISTRTTRYIKINGVRLMKGDGCWLYGKLKSGDVISVFELPEGTTARRPRDKDYLRFKCEFFFGGSREVRREGERFFVQTEKAKFNRYRESKSVEGSMISQGTFEGGQSGASAGVSVGVSAEASAGASKEPQQKGKEKEKEKEKERPTEKSRDFKKPDIPPRPPTPAIRHATLPGMPR